MSKTVKVTAIVIAVMIAIVLGISLYATCASSKVLSWTEFEENFLDTENGVYDPNPGSKDSIKETLTKIEVDAYVIHFQTKASSSSGKEVTRNYSVYFDRTSGSEVAQFDKLYTAVDRINEARKAENPENPLLIEYSSTNPNAGAIWSNLLPIVGYAVVLLLFFWMLRSTQGGTKGAFDFAKTNAQVKKDTKVRFADVAGAEEEKEELKEVVEFLKSPKKFSDLGARIPKGVLLVGPPGTGKTLFAKAVAGEAGVPFFSISGSDFVEMFVGVGASRVRDLFDTAKKNMPCIVFIDEIDAVGRQRGAGLGGGNDEREQTLNQLLVQMDGFESNDGIIIMAATNRADVLDPALMRPGRFDRQITVNLPDVRGREAILKVHARNKPLNPEVNFKALARMTTGFSGADLENLLNESAILAARNNRKAISNVDLNDAFDKLIMGLKKKSHLMTESDKRICAYHEAGHAILSKLLKHGDPVHEVTIIPRGNGAGGFTLMRPDTDDQMEPKGKYLDNIVMSLGGRVAEELVIQDISAGASADIRQVSRLARVMVTEWGMSDRVGPISYGSEQEVFIGRDYQTHVSYSEHMAAVIDQEVERIVKECLEKARELLSANRDIMENMARLLVERETIYGDEVDMLLERKPLDEIRKFMDDNEHRLKENPFSRKKSVVIPESEVRKAEKPASADDKAEEAGKTDQENSSLPSPGKEADRKDTEE